MKPARRLTVAAITAATLLAGAPAALAATAQPGQPGTAATPNTFKWLPHPGTYPTQAACQDEGRYIEIHVNNNYTFSCVRLNKGDYFVWKLFIGVPQ
jgi:hypothetical protein